MTKKELSAKTVAELRKVATAQGIEGASKKTKSDLVDSILSLSPSQEIKETTPSAEPAQAPIKAEAETQEVAKATSYVAPQVTAEPSPAQPQQVRPAAPQTPQVQPVDISNSNRPLLHRPINKPQHQQNQQRNQNQNQNQQRPRHQNQMRPQMQNQNVQNMQANLQNSDMDDARDYNNENTVEVSGILEIMSDGTHGVLRSPKLIPSDKDTYISISQVKKFRLRKGDFVTGNARQPKDNERYFSLLWIKDVNGYTVDQIQNRPNFDDLKPVYPDKQIKLEFGQYPVSNRVIDVLAPIGFGQRSMIVAQPKSGKTYLIKDIAKGINENHPNVQLIVVLIGERPEEVTDIERSVNGIVYASNFDDSPQNQVAVAELSLERAKRMVEMGQDVIILMDSLTRLARAYNVALPASGRTLSGGLDPVSLYPSKRFFGAARNFEVGASLTIVATALVETGSKMDEVIFEEFKGTGNMELHLDRKLANKRVFPAIDIISSGTRNEELLFGPELMQASWKIRRMLENLGNDANEALIDRMKSTKSNEDFLNTIHHY
jgi:transcription termination factor Rho